jgi:hypothetical protein
MRALARAAFATIASLTVVSMLTGTGAAQLPVPLPTLPALPSLPSLTPELLLDIANVSMPPEGGVSLQIHADFPDEAPFVLDGLEIYSLTADITPEGEVVLGSAQTAYTAASGSQSSGECSDDAFAPTGSSWSSQDEMPIVWHMNRRSIPSGISRDKTLLEARGAHKIWPHAFSDCADADRISFAYRYGGLTTKHPQFNGVNTIDFGSLGNGALAVNYAYFSGTRILEVDLRFNKADYGWSNTAGVQKYQVKNVMTHELGHQFGLDDLGDPHGALTMYGRTGKGERNKVSLGAGDVRGAEALSP